MAKIGINLSTGSLQKQEKKADTDPGSAPVQSNEDIATRALTDAKSEAGQMTDATEGFLQKNWELLREEEISAIYAAIVQLQEALRSTDKELILSRMEHLNEITRPFAERLMHLTAGKA